MSKKKYTKQPQKKRRKRGKHRKLKIVILIIIIALCAIILGGLGLLSAKYGINPKTIMQFKQEAVELVANSTADDFRPNKASIIYSDDEQEIAKLYQDEESTYLTFDEIPKNVINAFVAVEDRTFWEGAHGPVWTSPHYQKQMQNEKPESDKSAGLQSVVGVP